MEDERWWTVPALIRETGMSKSHIGGEFQRLRRWQMIEGRHNPTAARGAVRSGVALWRTGAKTPRGRLEDWPRAQAQRIFRITPKGHAALRRARLWQLLGLPWVFLPSGVRGVRSWPASGGDVQQAIRMAAIQARRDAGG